MKVILNRTNFDFAFEAKNEDGNAVSIDASPGIGGSGAGMRPMQLLLAALGGCSAIDVIHILKKQKQEIGSFQIEVSGTRETVKDYSLFRAIEIHFIIGGNVSREKAERAVELSMEKYCSVAKTLEPTAKITHHITINQHEK